MLPNPAIQDTYDKVVWVYVFRDFSGSREDRAAERISLRFSVTSWPQIFLADPSTLEIVKHTGRTVRSFRTAVGSTRIGRRDRGAWKRTQAAEARAMELEGRPGKALARNGLEDEDIVVRTRALQVLRDKDPAYVAKRAVELLKTPNDAFRYAVCEVLKAAADPAAAAALEALVKEPKPSLNPNVLRIRAVQALATCGSADSVPVIAPHAKSGAYFNGLTGVSVDALAAIAKREKKARKHIDKVLRECYPEPPDRPDARAMRACVALAKRVHKARGLKGFPKVYDAAARARLAGQRG